MPNSTSGKFPLSKAERSRLYHQRFRPPSYERKIMVSDKNIDGLLKLGYLGPDERDDEEAITQALSLFISDTLQSARLRVNSEQGAKR